MAAALAVLMLLALPVLAIAGVRRSRRRAAELEASLLAALRSRAADRVPELSLEIDEVAVATSDAGGRRALPRRRLTAAARKGHRIDAVAAAAVTLLTDPPRPHEGPFNLKLHGQRVRARCTTPAALALRPSEPPPANRPLEDLGLVVIYDVDGRFLTDDHLREQSIDTRDLHGIALAVQRQHFDEDLPKRAREGGEQVLRSSDGRAAALLLTLSDALAPGESLAARLQGPDWLGLAPAGHRWSGDESADSTFEPIDLAISPDGHTIL